MFMGLQGCFYWLPFVEVEPNMPPEITNSSPADGAPVIVNGDGATVFVVVQDENDPENLVYIWSVEGLGQVPHTPLVAGTLHGSSVELEARPEYDGRILDCWVYDSYGASSDREWSIEVPEEAR